MSNYELGPELWFDLHLEALHAIDDKRKKKFANKIKKVYKSIQCKRCKGHMKKFIKGHPLSMYDRRYDDEGKDIGMFLWSWKFHNDVNKRTDKRIMDFREAYKMYKVGTFRDSAFSFNPINNQLGCCVVPRIGCPACGTY